MYNRVSFYTFGCRLNQAETAAIQRSFEDRAYSVVDFGQTADLVVVNTCTVTANGDEDTRKLVRRINRTNPYADIALIGCQAQLQAENLTHLDNVRWVVGNAQKMNLAAIIRMGQPAATPFVDVSEIPRTDFTMPVPAVDRHHTRANLKIQDGCDFYCFFCVIPYARGRARSRQFDDIAREARALVAAGHREIVLTGVNIGTYRSEARTFLHVVQALTAIPGLARLRVSSIEPTTIPCEILTLMSSESTLCRYLHIPIQSASDEILYRMNRRYTVGEYTDFLLAAQRRVPHIGLGTDVIVGYPGESDGHFDETVDRLRGLPLAYFHVFSYSEREQAKSRIFPDKVAPRRITERSRILRELSSRKRRAYMEGFIDRVEDVLFEQRKKGAWSGLTDTYIRVHVKSELALENEIRPVRLAAVNGQVMVGELM